MRGHVCAAAAACFLLAGPVPAVRAEPELLEEERPDQPPGKPARDDAFARSPGMRVPFGSYESIQVNVDALGANIVGDAANEPAIAVNPLNPSNIVIGFRQFDTVSSNWRQAGFAYTFDGGQSWTFPGTLQPGFFRSDPSLDADASGTFYYQSLRGPSLWHVDVYRSTDGGVSWTGVPAFGGDKNWMVVDRSGGGADGALYGIWSRFNSCCGDNVFTRSFDGGLSFDPPVSVSRWPTYGTLAVGPDGEVYATGMDGAADFNRIVLATSSNASDPAAAPAFSTSDVDLGGYPITAQYPNPGDSSVSPTCSSATRPDRAGARSTSCSRYGRERRAWSPPIPWT
jgi:hypothetical protein